MRTLVPLVNQYGAAHCGRDTGSATVAVREGMLTHQKHGILNVFPCIHVTNTTCLLPVRLHLDKLDVPFPCPIPELEPLISRCMFYFPVVIITVDNKYS